MPQVTFEQLLDAGVHFGHLKRKWNPNMAPYIFMERNGIHVIDLYKTKAKLDEAADALKQISKSGKKVLFVATKKQAQEIVQEKVKKTGMPYVTHRWPGGMLTNFATIRKAVKKMSNLDKLMNDPNKYGNMSKRERLQIERERTKLETQFGSIADLNRHPAAIFVVDIIKEHIAIKEAKKLAIPTFAMVDTNSDPNEVDFPIPSNDDASKSISLIVDVMTKAVEEGMMERKAEKEEKAKQEKEAKQKEKEAQKQKEQEAKEQKEQEAQQQQEESASTDEGAETSAKKKQKRTRLQDATKTAEASSEPAEDKSGSADEENEKGDASGEGEDDKKTVSKKK
ncbi:MAG: 30S ribosomal protein S2 [Bacteroidales bacterium]|nr:30S ribosomal protein S2 [Bacteroidales bacterium]MCF8333300.1 30S ribosomal protein S2 [Bacteroidales bacterium]